MRMPRVRFSVRGMMLAVAIAGAVLGFLAAMRAVLLAERRRGLQGACYSSLNHIAMALDSYSTNYDRFPRPFQDDVRGARMHSWRPLLLAWYPLHYTQVDSCDINRPWDDPANSKLSSEVPGFMGCPSEIRDNPHGSPFVMINDFGETPIGQIPGNAILVIEAWGANRNWLDPHDRVEVSPRLRISATDHPDGFGVILRDYRRVSVRDPSRIRKVDGFYVLDE